MVANFFPKILINHQLQFAFKQILTRHTWHKVADTGKPKWYSRETDNHRHPDFLFCLVCKNHLTLRPPVLTSMCCRFLRSAGWWVGTWQEHAKMWCTLWGTGKGRQNTWYFSESQREFGKTRNWTFLQMILFDWKESEPGSCGHSTLAVASPSNMLMVRSSTAAKPSSPEMRDASNPICTIPNGYFCWGLVFLPWTPRRFQTKPERNRSDLQIKLRKWCPHCYAILLAN